MSTNNIRVGPDGEVTTATRKPTVVVTSDTGIAATGASPVPLFAWFLIAWRTRVILWDKFRAHDFRFKSIDCY